MIDTKEHAEAWVSAWVEKHIKTRVLDGRPDRIFIATLKDDVARLLQDFEEASRPAPKPKAKKAKSDE